MASILDLPRELVANILDLAGSMDVLGRMSAVHTLMKKYACSTDSYTCLENLTRVGELLFTNLKACRNEAMVFVYATIRTGPFTVKHCGIVLEKHPKTFMVSNSTMMYGVFSPPGIVALNITDNTPREWAHAVLKLSLDHAHMQLESLDVSFEECAGSNSFRTTKQTYCHDITANFIELPKKYRTGWYDRFDGIDCQPDLIERQPMIVDSVRTIVDVYIHPPTKSHVEPKGRTQSTQERVCIFKATI